jgi:hypothetical protein
LLIHKIHSDQTLVNQNRTAVFGKGILGVGHIQRLLFAIADDGELLSLHTQGLQILGNSLGTTLAQGDVVLRGTALVGVTFDQDFNARALAQVAGVGIQQISVLTLDIVTVEREVDDVVTCSASNF